VRGVQPQRQFHSLFGVYLKNNFFDLKANGGADIDAKYRIRLYSNKRQSKVQNVMQLTEY